MGTANLESLIYLGIKGSVIALDRRTGMPAWKTHLNGSDFVNVAFDGVCVFATVRGEIFCLDALTGQIYWNNPLKGMGWGLCTIAGDGIVPFAQQRAIESQQAAATAAASASV